MSLTISRFNSYKFWKKILGVQEETCGEGEGIIN
jgi:hypothetical protein